MECMWNDDTINGLVSLSCSWFYMPDILGYIDNNSNIKHFPSALICIERVSRQ